MKKHLYRTLLIYAMVVISLVCIYPTIGWMLLSDDQREARKIAWAQEDSVYHEPSYARDMVKSVRRWAQFDRSKVVNLGLDLQGGIHMVLGLDMEKIDPERKAKLLEYYKNDSDLEQHLQQVALQTIQRRIDQFEAKEPIIQTSGRSQIQIQLPGEKDIQRAKNLIMKTAYLTFHLAAGPDETVKIVRQIEAKFPKQFVPQLSLPSKVNQSTFLEVPVNNIESVKRILEEARQIPGLIPEGKMFRLSGPPKPYAKHQAYLLYLLDEKPLMDGTGLVRADARPDERGGGSQWTILFELNSDSGRQFHEITTKNVKRNMAIVVDNVVVSAPTIQSPISTNGQITGDFNREESQDLAIALSSGSMPVPVREEFTGVVDASLGADSIKKGVWSIVISAVAVVAFMLIYYHMAGVVANIALAMNLLLMIGLFAYFKLTLTLPGMAGFALTIGMAVDGNILIYERIREELRNGKKLLSAIDAGFKRATVTIMDSQLTTLIAGIVLLQFGTGPVQGFAVALNIGVITTIFTNIWVSRAVFDFLTSRKSMTDLSMLSVIKHGTKIPFLRQRYICFAVGAIVILIGWTAFFVRGQANYGVDFTTGTSVDTRLEVARIVDVSEVRGALDEAGFVNATIQKFEEAGKESGNRFFVRIGQVDVESGTSTPETTVSGRVQTALAKLCDNEKQVKMDRVATVGPAVGKQLKIDAIKAVLWSLVFICLYMWFRFDLKYGVGGVLAMAHDVAITVGMFALTRREIDMTVIAALLTIIGYSLNDTIVVFDRVRENVKLLRGRGLTLMQIMDLSINETLSRTILTVLTVFLTAVVMYFLGGETINNFAFAMVVGSIVGAYSSIYVASPIALIGQAIHERFKGRHAQEQETAAGSSRRRRSLAGKASNSKEATV